MDAGGVHGFRETSLAHLIDPKRKWYNNKRLIALNIWVVLLLATPAIMGYDGSMMNGLQSLPQWESTFNFPSSGNLGLISSSYSIGALVGFPLTPYLSDGVGRCRAVWFASVIMCIATAIQTTSESVHMFIGARFLLGFGSSFAANAAPMLVTELSYPTHRAPLTSLYNTLWNFGAIIAAWSTFGSFRINNSWAWRLPSLLQGVPSVLLGALVLFAPESPRWLLSKGREVEALRTLAYYHADGNEQDPLVQFEFTEIKAALELDRTIAANVGWKALFATQGNRNRMRVIIALAIFSQWSGIGIIAYYFPQMLRQIGITNPSIQLLVNGLLQIWAFASGLCTSFAVNRFGRRFLFLVSAGLMTVCYVALTICFAEYAQHGTTHAARAAIAFIFVFASGYMIAFGPIVMTYAVEILPFALRAKGLSIYFSVIALALAFNQYVNPIALASLGWKYYIVYACWLVFEFVFVWFFVVETMGRTLEETAALFDGEDALEQIARRAAVVVRDVREADALEKTIGQAV